MDGAAEEEEEDDDDDEDESFPGPAKSGRGERVRRKNARRMFFRFCSPDPTLTCPRAIASEPAARSGKHATAEVCSSCSMREHLEVRRSSDAALSSRTGSVHRDSPETVAVAMAA